MKPPQLVDAVPRFASRASGHASRRGYRSIKSRLRSVIRSHLRMPWTGLATIGRETSGPSEKE